MRSLIFLKSILFLVSFCLSSSLTCAAGDGKPTGSTLKGWNHSLKSTDIGTPSTSGSAKAIDGGIEMIAGGKDNWGVSDEFHFVYKKQSGDFDIATRIESLTAPHFYSGPDSWPVKIFLPTAITFSFSCFPTTGRGTIIRALTSFNTGKRKVRRATQFTHRKTQVLLCFRWTFPMCKFA
jgi:hypothetical protein